MPAKSPQPTPNTERALLELGRKLRERRKALGVSSIVTAEAAGMSRVTLYRVERGEASVSMGAYLSVIKALGLSIELVDLNARKNAKNSLSKIPKKIRIVDYKQLKRLAWQLKGTKEITPEEALDIYERNWRHVDLKKMDAQEKKFIDSLLAHFGRERLLV